MSAAAAAKLTPLQDLRVLTHHIPAYIHTPNTSLQQKPLLIYKAAFLSPTTAPATIESHLSSVGVVNPQWRYTMYGTSHYHSTSHEVLVVFSGTARLCFGHEDNASRVMETVGVGDVIVVPAGVAHRLWEDVSEGGGGRSFEMVGCYPPGCQWDMCYGRPGEEEDGAWERIKRLGWFERDPVYGDQGPVLEV